MRGSRPVSRGNTVLHVERRPLGVLLLVSLTVAGCSAGISSPQLGLTAMPKLPSVPELPKLPAPPPPAIGSPTDVYTNVARGALTCWFGTKGPLKGQYIYHGEAEPPSKGGRAVIVIHVLDREAPSPRGLRAYHIVISQESPEVERTLVAAENLRIPEPLASRMTEDVRRWAAAETGCGEQPPAESWTASEAKLADPARGASAARPRKQP